MGRDTAKDLATQIARTGKKPKRLKRTTASYIGELVVRQANRQVEGLKGKARKEALKELLA